MTPMLRVLAPGLMTTVQDLGRLGRQRFGVPVSGAFDPVSLQAANIVAGNPSDTAGLEVAFHGPTLEVAADGVRVAVAGADALIEVLGETGSVVPALQSVTLERGQQFRVGALKTAAVAYLAVEGGLALAPVLGSLSTYTRAALGGLEGRALRAGDRLPLTRGTASQRPEARLTGIDLAPRPCIKVVLGPQQDYFTERAIATLLGSSYTVGRASDRMGMRLDGPALEHARGYNIVSDGIAPGSIQVPGNGLPIVLLADRQTTGGYPKIATVISADLPALGRLVPGSSLTFEAVTIEAAQAARRAQAAEIAGWRDRLEPVPLRAVVDVEKLGANNLVSGVVHAHEGWWE